MKRLMKAMSQRFGCWIQSASTRSPAIVISGRSVSRICLGSNGRNGRIREAHAIENMFPKLALVAMNTYFSSTECGRVRDTEQSFMRSLL
jgi:hypothetical protein